MNRNLSPGPEPETPELDKRHLILEDANTIGEFLEWLTTTRGIHLAEMRDDMTGHAVCMQCFGAGEIRGKLHEPCNGTGMIAYTARPQLVTVFPDFEALLAEYYDLDLNKIELERRAILEQIRTAS